MFLTGCKMKKYSEMSNAEIKKIFYEECPLKCVSRKEECDEVPIGQCRKNLSEQFDKDSSGF